MQEKGIKCKTHAHTHGVVALLKGESGAVLIWSGKGPAIWGLLVHAAAA